MGAEGGDGIGAEGQEEVVGVGAGRARLEREKVVGVGAGRARLEREEVCKDEGGTGSSRTEKMPNFR